MSYIVYFNLMSYIVRNSYITKNSDFHYFGTTIKVSAVLWLSRLHGGGIHPQAPAAPHQSLAGDCTQSLAQEHFQQAQRSTQEQERENASRTEVTASYNLIAEETFPHFCHILFIRSKSSHTTGTQGESRQGVNPQRQSQKRESKRRR